jgi:dolichol-phosphate mannosyltransferase
MTPPLISLVIPVRNEHENIGVCLGRLWDALRDTDHEVLVCYDSEKDTTLPAIANTQHKSPQLRLIRNDLGPGPSMAMRAGMQAARGDVIVVTMADLSDPPDAIPAMAARIRDGADIVSGSRYMRGGRQVGGPRLKTLLSRMAGLSLCWVAGFGTHDATTSFRAFSQRLLQRITIESTTGFTLGLEVTTKAHLQGFVVDEVPVTWTDRSAGESNFRVARWLGAYLRWYTRAMAVPLLVWACWLGVGVTRAFLSSSALLPTGIAVVTSFGTIVIARRVRRRMSAVDAAAPLGWLLPEGPLGLAPALGTSVALIVSLSVLGHAWTRRRRPPR